MIKSLKRLSIILMLFLIIMYLGLRFENLILPMKFIVLLAYFITILLSYLNNQMITFLFLGSLFLFQYGRIILLPLFGYEVEMTWFHYIKFSLETDIFVTDLLFINLLGIYIGNLISKKNNIKLTLSKEKNENIKKKIIFILIFLFLPFYFKFSFEILSTLKNLEYIDYYRIGMSNLNKSNFLEKICYNIYLFTIFFGLSLKKLSKKEKLFFIILNIINTFFTALRGTRAIFLANICFSIWYLSREKIIKLDIKKLIIIGISLFSLIIGLQNFREKKEVISNNSSITKILEKVIRSQGTTGTFLCLLKEKTEIFEKDKIPFIISNLIGLRLKPQNKENSNKIINSNNVVLADKMSVTLNRDKYIEGKGMGGNYIIEMFDLGGKFGIIFLSTILTLFLNFIDRNYNSFSWITRSFFIFIIPKIFLIPRFNYFIYIPIKDLIRFLFVYFLIIVLSEILKNKKMESNFEKRNIN